MMIRKARIAAELGLISATRQRAEHGQTFRPIAWPLSLGPGRLTNVCLRNLGACKRPGRSSKRPILDTQSYGGFRRTTCRLFSDPKAAVAVDCRRSP